MENIKIGDVIGVKNDIKGDGIHAIQFAGMLGTVERIYETGVFLRFNTIGRTTRNLGYHFTFEELSL